MINAIIHTKTGVVRRLTTDVNPGFAPDETVVPVEDGFNLDNGYWKIDKDGNKVQASDKEVDDSDVDDAKRSLKLKKKSEDIDAVTLDIAENGATLKKLQDYFKLIRG